MNLGTNEKKVRHLETFKRLINLGLTAVCLGLEIGIFAYWWQMQFRWSVVEALRYFQGRGHVLEVSIYGVILILLSSMYGGIRLGYLKNVELIFSQVFATLMANIFIYAELSVMAAQPFVPDVFILMMVEQTIVVIIYINVANRLYRAIFPPRKLLLIHGDRPIESICGKFAFRKDKYIITRTIHVEEGFEAVSRAIVESYESGECNAVVLGDISVVDRTPLIKFCYGHSIRFYLLPKITDVILMGAEELHVFDSPMLLTREYSLTVEQRIIKRCIDVVGALVLLVLASPFMLLTALAIKLYDGGPILYKQVRCNQDQTEMQAGRAAPVSEYPERGHVLHRSQAGAAGNHRPVSGGHAGVRLSDESKGRAGRFCPGIRQIQYIPLRQTEAGSDLYRELFRHAGHQADAADPEDSVLAGQHRGRGGGADHSPAGGAQETSGEAGQKG